MWIDKIRNGVLQVQTPLGYRYVKPKLRQRVALLWTFRHFHTLPAQVLNRREQWLIENVSSRQAFVAPPRYGNGEYGDLCPIIGIVEDLEPRHATAYEAAAQKRGSRFPLMFWPRARKDFS